MPKFRVHLYLDGILADDAVIEVEANNVLDATVKAIKQAVNSIMVAQVLPDEE